MKKIAYQTPEVKVKALFMDQLLAGSMKVNIDDQPTIGGGGSDDDGTLDPAAKDGFNSHSVWDD